MNLDVVRKGYDVIAESYFLHRVRLRTDRYVQMFLMNLEKASMILDVGCGAGIPVDDVLIRKGHLVTGIDISAEQIRRAKKNCPRGEYVVQNMMDLREGAYRVDAVISVYALFHIPRKEHGKMLKRWASFLPKGGWMLVTMGDSDFEGFHDLLGWEMWSSHFGPTINRKLVEAAGFRIELDEMDESGGERHQILLAQKR